ncbi:MAG: glycosyltransferase [Euryarchaeota archaeon]|nr:glycosyltransferase [Euryarchaeota archaeon]
MTTSDSLDVCFLINHLDAGGAQTLLRNIVALDDRPHVSYTVCYAGGPNEFSSEFETLGVDVVDLGARTDPPQFDPRAVARTLQYFGTHDVDVVHGHLPYGAVLGRIAGRRADAAVVTTHHSVRQNYHPIERTLERATRRYDDATVFVSDAVAGSFDGPTDDTLVETIYNGIDVAGFREQLQSAAADQVRADLGVADELLVLQVGRCIEAKRQLDLVRAVDRLTDRLDDPGVHVAIVGDGPQRSELEAAVRDRGLDAHVSIVGRVSPSRIHDYYAAADAYAQVSAYEGMPMTLLEAMASGLPLVGTEVPGIAEFIDSETGLLVPPESPPELADAMAALRAVDHRTQLGRASLTRVAERYEIDRTVEAYHEIYEQVTAGRMSAAPEATMRSH